MEKLLFRGPWWFSVGICKYKPGYKSHDLLEIQCTQRMKLQHSDWRANIVKDFFVMRALEIITGHVNYTPAYTYKFQLKTTM